MYYLEAGYRKHDRLRNALLAALVLHLVLVLGVSFTAAQKEYRAPQIEVTLATRSSDFAPEEARLMAQANQVGSGDQAESMARLMQELDAELLVIADEVARHLQQLIDKPPSAQDSSTAIATT